MALIPAARLVEEASSIIASSKILESVDWKFLMSKLPSEVYRGLVGSTLDKYSLLHQNYLEVAKKCA